MSGGVAEGSSRVASASMAGRYQPPGVTVSVGEVKGETGCHRTGELGAMSVFMLSILHYRPQRSYQPHLVCGRLTTSDRV